MGALQVLAFVASALLVLENGCWQVEGAAYTYTTRHQSSSSNRSPARAAATQPKAVVAPGTRNRAELAVTDYRRYLPVEDTPEVKKAKDQFFSLYKKQALLAAEAPDNDLDGTRTATGAGAYRAEGNYVDYEYYDYEEESDEGDDDHEEDDDDEEDDDSTEEGEDSSDEEDSSSSSEEDEYGDDSSEEGDSSSSEEDLYGEDSSSSSSSSEEDEGAGTYSGGYQPLNTNALAAPRPVTDTPEVKKAKRKFFDLYKAQAELSFNALTINKRSVSFQYQKLLSLTRSQYPRSPRLS
ncbi:YTH domain-containing protein 1-like [Palaemon carinicauda]|uniref:YTH domain-containing protein 1-like n=1 Tax=Palaemon carinicauda TaxID=392227 RepID=UPI0035B651DC